MALTSPTLIALRQMAFGDMRNAPPFGQYRALAQPPPSTAPPPGGGAPPPTLGPNVPPPWSGRTDDRGGPRRPTPPPAQSRFSQLRDSLNYTPVNPTSPDIPSDRPGGTHTLSGPAGVQVNYNDRPDSQRISDYFGLQMGESSPMPGPVGNVSLPMYTGRNADSNLAYEVDIPTAQIEHWIARGDTERDIRMRLGLPV